MAVQEVDVAAEHQQQGRWTGRINRQLRRLATDRRWWRRTSPCRRRTPLGGPSQMSNVNRHSGGWELTVRSYWLAVSCKVSCFTAGWQGAPVVGCLTHLATGDHSPQAPIATAEGLPHSWCKKRDGPRILG